MENIYCKLLQELKLGRPAVLAAILSDSGSAPRKAGSMMLVGEAGLLAGTIGGGAVEKACVEQSLSLLAEKCSTVKGYGLHLGSENDTGMVCGGEVEVFFQYAPCSPEWISLLESVSERYASSESARLIFQLDGSLPSLDEENFSPVKAFLRDGDRLIVPLELPNRALVFGAGHIAKALVPILKSVGFYPVVFDDRPEYASSALFPEADRIICGDFERISDYLDFRPRDFAVIVTSGHAHDYAVELQALKSELSYIGVIGSRAKTASVNKRLSEAGISDERLGFVHTPIGTKIKAVTPQEIAVSIAGELIMVRAELREAASGKADVLSCPVR